MDVHELRRHEVVAECSLDAFGHHRLIGYQEKRAGGNFIMKAGDEDGGGLHVDPHAADASEIFLERLVVLPDTPVGGVDGAGPVIAVVVADGGRDRFLKGERRERRDLGREVIGGCAFASNGGDGKNEVAEFVLLL